MKITTLLSVGCLIVAPTQAAVVAYWNFNDLTTSTNNGTTYAATSGAGSITVGVAAEDQAGNNRGINSFAGSTVNAISPDPAGQALTIQGGASESTTPVQNNGATVTISVDLTGYADPIVSFSTRRTGTGFNSNQFSWSTNGTTFTNFGSSYNPPDSSTFSLITFDLSSIDSLDNSSTVFFRITLDGATANAGNNRIDNVQVNATAVPEPAAALLGALGLLTILRRRRA